MSIEIDTDSTLRILRELVACDSINPAFHTADGEPGRGEAEIVRRLEAFLAEMGLETHVHDAAPGRPSVVGVLRGSGGGRSLMLNGHVDTVGPGKMESPFSPRLEDGRLYGRGAYDMKGGVAACLGAARALAASGARLAGDLVVALVADEEVASLGTQDIARRYSVDGAVVTEPTELGLCLAHKGFTWVRIRTRGFAYHGSMWQQGVDANLRMGAILGRLAPLVKRLQGQEGHALVGPPSLHAPLLSGGAGPSIYSPECTLQLERRTIPGETPEQVMTEVRDLVAGLDDEIPADDVTVEEVLSREPFEADPDGAVARLVDEAHGRRTGDAPEVTGAPFWTDAAILSSAGADTVLYGPAGTGAHADVEWVDVESVMTCAQVLADVASRYCGEP